MEDTATPETGPVDAPASVESIVAELESGGESPADSVDAIVQELVNEAEGNGEPAEAEPGTEDDATEPADEAEDAPEGNPDEQTYTVKVNGEERQVPLDELLKGYSRTEDYKAKTAEVAEQRRTLEAERSQVEARVAADYANQLEEATNLFAQFDPILAEARTIDWQALKQTDPAAYVQAQEAVQERLNAIQHMQARVQETRNTAQQRQQQNAEQERAERFDATADAIVKAMPELADEGRFQEFAGANIEFLRGMGFQQGEIADYLDARVLTLADKARRWDAHEAAQRSLSEKRVVPKSAVKPLTTDGGNSRAKPRFPSNASRDGKLDWIATQILSEDA